MTEQLKIALHRLIDSGELYIKVEDSDPPSLQIQCKTMEKIEEQGHKIKDLQERIDRAIKHLDNGYLHASGPLIDVVNHAIDMLRGNP